MHPDLNVFKDSLFNIGEHELEKYIGKKCYVKFKGTDPKWGVEKEGITVLRANGDTYEEDNIILQHPSDEPRIFEIKHLQKAWGYNSEGKYVPNTTAFRIYALDDEHQFGQPAHLEDVIIIEDQLI